jgi:transposase
MARYRDIDMNARLLPVSLDAQIVPGSFAHAVYHLVGELDLSGFDAHYRNDETGAPAHAPAMLLRAVLLAYSQGMSSSRAIERACRDNVVFIAMTGDAKPHFTTIADFVSRSGKEISAVFAQVLTILDGEGLIGREMFAIDGVKLPSNASKHRSGTRREFLAKAQKLERVAAQMLERHRINDGQAQEPAASARITARTERMSREARQIREWLASHPEDRTGPQGGLRKSNRTDNDSAKLATDKGVIQGYCGVAVVDAKHQVIVEAQAHGTGSEQELLLPVLDACAAQRTPATLITADAGYHSEANLAALAERGVDALIADGQMRQRDERLSEQGKHAAKADPLHDKSGRKAPKVFGARDFTFAADHSHAICPAGKTLHRNGKDCTIGGYRAIKFRAPRSTCKDCPLRSKCLRKPDTTPTRQVALLMRKDRASHTERMRARIDSEAGRRQYGRRFATVEPVFGNLRSNKRLNRFTLRGRSKVDGQWKLFALVHNIEKWANYRNAA